MPEETKEERLKRIYDDLVSQPYDNLIMVMNESTYKAIMDKTTLEGKKTIYGIRIIQVKDDNDVVEDNKILVIKASAFKMMLEEKPSFKAIYGGTFRPSNHLMPGV